jgi:hypothetical protein
MGSLIRWSREVMSYSGGILLISRLESGAEKIPIRMTVYMRFPHALLVSRQQYLGSIHFCTFTI